MKCDIFLKDFAVLTPGYDVEDHVSVAVRGGVIAKVAPAAEMPAVEADMTLEGGGKLLMPGLTDAHTHSCQQLLRGRLADEYPMIWMRFLVPFESTLTEDDVYFSALLFCLQEIKAGVTAFADAGGRHMHMVAKAVAKAGMRAAITRSMIDSGKGILPQMVERTEEAIANSDALFEEFHGAENGRIKIFYGMRQVMTCSPRLIELVARHAALRGTGVHAHLCEHRDEVSFCLQNYQMRPAAFLDKMGLLGPNLLTAHNVVLSEGDITLLAKRQVKLVHCPFANLGNHGFPKTPRLLEAGCSVGLGTDGAAYNSLDLFEEMRMLRTCLIAHDGLPVFDPAVLPVKEILRMAIAGGAAAMGGAREWGAVEEGRKADLITVNTKQPHIYPSRNRRTALLDCVTARDVCDSIIDGSLVMRDRRVLTLDEEALMQECAQRMEAIARRTP